ncbi:hypothetical protein ACLKA7_017318 [Drosophila subpalustris]
MLELPSVFNLIAMAAKKERSTKDSDKDDSIRFRFGTTSASDGNRIRMRRTSSPGWMMSSLRAAIRDGHW